MTEEIFGYIHSIETFGALDGPGIRYVLFMQGCKMRCSYCHNPDTWQIGSGKLVSVKNIIEDIFKYKSFILEGGVTISGGEPLLQPEFCYNLVKECKKKNLHTAIDTSGSVPLSLCKRAIDITDLILLDIKAEDDILHKKITGTSNTNTFILLNYLESINKSVWIRHVIVPNLTLDYDNLRHLAKTLKKYKCIKRVDLLPFHKMGEYKWKQLEIESPLVNTPTPNSKEMQKVKEIFKSEGVTV